MFCGNCGHKIEEGSNWCGNCGIKIDDSVNDANSYYNDNYSKGVSTFLQKGDERLVKTFVKIYMVLGICAIVFALKNFIVSLSIGFYLPYPFSQFVYYVEDMCFALMGNFGPIASNGSSSLEINTCKLISTAIMFSAVLIFYLVYKKYPKKVHSLNFMFILIFVLGLIYSVGNTWTAIASYRNYLLNYHVIVTVIGSICTVLIRLYLMMYFIKLSNNSPIPEQLDYKNSRIMFVCSVFLIIVCCIDIFPVITTFVSGSSLFNASTSVWASIPLSIMCFGAGYSGIKAAKQKDWSLSAFCLSVVVLVAFCISVPCVLFAFGSMLNTGSSLGSLSIAINSLLLFYLIIYSFMIISPAFLAYQAKKKLELEK